MSLINIFSNVCGLFIDLQPLTNKKVSDLKEALNVKIGFQRHWLKHVYIQCQGKFNITLF